MSRVESSIERSAVLACLTQYGVKLLKVSSDGETGWPDRVALLPHGRVVWLEFKDPVGEVEPKQNYIHAYLRSLGHEVHVCYSREQAFGVIKSALEAAAVYAEGCEVFASARKRGAPALTGRKKNKLHIVRAKDIV